MNGKEPVVLSALGQPMGGEGEAIRTKGCRQDGSLLSPLIVCKGYLSYGPTPVYQLVVRGGAA